MKNLNSILFAAFLLVGCSHQDTHPDIPDVVVKPTPTPSPGPDLPPAPGDTKKKIYKVEKIGELPSIEEKSGICLGGDGLFYVIQDSDQSPKVSVIDRSGKLIRKVEMDGVAQNDFEDVACYKEKVTVGDIGDNDEERDHFTLYTFVAPTGSAPKVKAEKVDVKFADGKAHNAEGLFYRPDGHLYLTTKEFEGAQKLYEIKDKVAYPVRDINGVGPIGAAASSLDGEKILLAIDESNEFFECSFSGSKCEKVAASNIPSGDHEAVTYTSDHSFIFLSEDEDSLHEVSWSYDSEPVPTPTPDPGEEEPTPEPDPVGVWYKPAVMENVQVMSSNDGDYLKQLKPGIKLVEIECVPDKDEGESAGYARLKGIIEKFHAAGVNVLCYHSLSYEHWRADIHRFPMAAKGAKMSGWDELWPDWRSTSPAHSFWDQRYDNFAAIGADCVEDDNMVDPEDNETGFPLTHAQSAASAKRRAEYAHSVGLCHISKNNPTMSKSYAEVSDGVMIEEAGKYNERANYIPWKDAGKFGVMIEYSKSACKPYSGFTVQYHPGSDYFRGVDFQLCK